MKTNLTTEQGRKSAIEQIEQSFIKSLREIGVELSEEVICIINETSIYLSIKSYGERRKKGYKTAFSAEVILHIDKVISYGSSGSLTPENKESYWRTIHAASILKNWDKVCEQVNIHCKRYSELVEEIKKQK
jgi:hypothetical protein